MMFRKPTIFPPFGGWDNSGPSLSLPATSFKQITNFLLRDNRIISPPKISRFATVGLLNEVSNPPEVLMGARTFIDAQGFYHTIYITNYRSYVWNPQFLVFTPFWTWRGLNGFPNISSSQLFSIEIYQNVLYFCNGYLPIMRNVGDNLINLLGPNPGPVIPNPNTIVGDFPGSCFFFGKLAGRLIALNTTEPYSGQAGATNYPSRIRWCALNNPLEWQNTIDLTAGVLDLTEVEDQLTGWVTINQTGFAFRSNGITALSATGNSTLPFYLENFSIGPSGVGCAIPFTLSSYGYIACFVAVDNVYLFDGGAPQPIGTSARRAIFKDLASSSSQPFGQMIGTLTKFVDYLTYWLCIPQQNDTITSVWIYHFDDKSWINLQLPYGAMRCVTNVAVA